MSYEYLGMGIVIGLTIYWFWNTHKTWKKQKKKFEEKRIIELKNLSDVVGLMQRFGRYEIDYRGPDSYILKKLGDKN